MRTILISAALLAGLNACATQVPATVQCDFRPMTKAIAASGPALLPRVPGTMQPVPLNAVSLTDTRISNKVLVQDIVASRTATGTISVDVRMMNCTDAPIQVQARSLFFDDQQRSAEPPSAWGRVYLPPRAIGNYTEKSISAAQASAYLVELRKGD